MIRWLLLWLVMGTLWAGCGGVLSEEKEPKTPVSPASIMVEAQYPFCDENQLDRFVMDYHGDTSQVFLYVISYRGDTLTRQQWRAEAFLSDSLAQLPEGTQREAAILGMMRATVVDNPTRRMGEEWPNGDPMSEDVREILLREGADRIFAIRLASGKTQLIAWSPSLQAAIQML